MSLSEHRKQRARFAVFATVAVASALAATTGDAFVIEDKEGNLPKKEAIEPAAAPAIHVEASREPIPEQDNAEMTAVIPGRVPMPRRKPPIEINFAEGKGQRKPMIEINFAGGKGGGEAGGAVGGAEAAGAAGGAGRGDGDD